MTQEDKNKFAALVRSNKEWSELELSQEILSSLRRILTEIYSTNAHFIYELLQNAEDQAAKKVEFVLNDGELVFRHDGNLFSYEDVESISKVACSTKSKDDTRIGKFGVGFKSVFSYTDEPEIHSGEWHFKIKDLVVPEAVVVDDQSPQTSELHGTIFRFPLGCSAKNREAAHHEISKGLNALSVRAILFLQHIEEISIRIDNCHVFLRRSLEGNLLTLSREVEGDGAASLMRFLRFGKEVEINTVEDGSSVIKKLPIGLAYLLLLKDGESDDGDLSHYRIVPSNDNNVFIYFPAEKELSNLKFCIHAAFAPTVNRDSIRTDDPDNAKLMAKLVELQKESFEFLKGNGFLTTDFLAVLPNSGDNLSGEYGKFREMAQQVFRGQEYTPTKDGGHAPASSLRQTAIGYAALNDIFSFEELSRFEDCQLKWVRNASQTNSSREAVFIRDLEIPSWGIEELVSTCQKRQPAATEVFGRKTNSDLIKLYDLLLKYERQELHFDFDRKSFVTNVRKIKLIRLNDGTMASPSEGWIVYGAIPESAHDAKILHQDLVAARDFLDLVGIKEYDEKAILEHYINRTWDDLRNQRSVDRDENKLYFLMTVDALAGNRALPSNILRLPVLSANDKWIQINHAYIDEPYRVTGLERLRTVLARIGIQPLSSAYVEDMSDQEKDCISRESSKLGLVSTLQIIDTPVNENPGYNMMLRRAVGNRMSATCKEIDFDIGLVVKGEDGRNQLRIFSSACDIVPQELANPLAAQLVWDAILNSREKELRAVYQPKRGAEEASEEAAFVQRFANVAWIPVGAEIKKPCDVEFEDLPNSWERPLSGYDHPALSAIRFGQSTADARRQRAIDTEVLSRYGLTIEEARQRMIIQDSANRDDNVHNGNRIPARKQEVSDEEKYLSIDKSVIAKVVELCELQNDDAGAKDVLAGQNAKVVSIPELLSMNLQIPDYQRPYEWDEKNVRELLEDIRTAQKAQKKSYRIGSVILQKKAVADDARDKVARYDIVDGQQRTVTLILLCSALAALGQDVQVPSVLNKKEFYPSLKRCKVSQRNVHDNFAVISGYLRDRGEADAAKFADAVKNKLEVVVISVDEQSEAFQLFDSQNSRGRRLEPHDLLKAYHLRAARGVSPTCIDCAVKKWEAHKNGDISTLFADYLYRIYKWGRMEKCESFTTEDMAVFKGLPMDGTCVIPYAYAKKAWLSRHGFQIGEPIVPGLDFFRMVEHYFALREMVMKEVAQVEAVSKAWNSYHGRNGCAYVEGLFEAALLCYFDRFGFDDADSSLAIRKLFKWAYTVRTDLEYLGPKTPNKYALGGDGGYANKYSLFAKIRNAREHFEITNLVVNASNDVQSKWSELNNQLKTI